MDVSVSPGPLLKELSWKTLYMHRFLQLCSLQQVSLLFSAMFWCLQVHSLRVCATASYLRCLSRVKGKWGWPRLESNNYLGHVCVPYAITAGSASWDYMHAACAHVHTRANTRSDALRRGWTNSCALSLRRRAAQRPSILGRSFIW